MAALDGIAGTVKPGGFLDLGRVGEVLCERLAQRRAEIAAQVQTGDIYVHLAEDLFQCIQDAGCGINERSVHVE